MPLKPFLKQGNLVDEKVQKSKTVFSTPLSNVSRSDVRVPTLTVCLVDLTIMVAQPMLQSAWAGGHCVKSVQIRSYFWSVFSCIRIEYGDLVIRWLARLCKRKQVRSDHLLMRSANSDMLLWLHVLKTSEKFWENVSYSVLPIMPVFQ